MDTETIVSRFRHERQVLASLNHPNIAALLDGGTTPNGLPYFAMEYIEGQNIVDFCESRKLDTTARLQLFRQVCSAVHRVGDLLSATGNLKESLTHRRTALAIMQEVALTAPDDVANQRQLGIAFQKLGALFSETQTRRTWETSPAP